MGRTGRLHTLGADAPSINDRYRSLGVVPRPGLVHATGPGFGTLDAGSNAMNITSPFFVVPMIIVVFAACIFFGASTKEDGHSDHDEHAAH